MPETRGLFRIVFCVIGVFVSLFFIGGGLVIERFVMWVLMRVLWFLVSLLVTDGLFVVIDSTFGQFMGHQYLGLVEHL